MPAGGSGSFLYEGLFYDAEKQTVIPCVTPGFSERYPDSYTIVKNPISVMNGQWGRAYYGSTELEIVFAYTRYQVPDGVPARPEGSGMTVTYELDITI